MSKNSASGTRQPGDSMSCGAVHIAPPLNAGLDLIAEFERCVSKCQTLNDLKSLLEEVTVHLGFCYFALLHHATLRLPRNRMIRVDNYPSEWELEIRTRRFAADDPVHLASLRTNAGFSWHEIGQLVHLSDRHHLIFERSHDFGIGDGFTVPVNVPGEPAGSCSFALRVGKQLPQHDLLSAELIGTRAFKAARQLTGCCNQRPPPHLSRRELQCLPLLARGKTDWEIAKVLGLSIETARHYVKRARAAYHVTTRTQLVVHSLRDSRISFDDALCSD
jgi:LuxR family transcriptional regulator, quorum-sensing system regulator CciR